MSKSKKYFQYFSIYTALFAVAFIVNYFVFFKNGTSFIWYKDGKAQHFPALVYIGRFYREYFRNILHGSFYPPTFDSSLVWGGDALITLNFYGLGDPLTMLSAFVPKRHTEVLYNVLIVLRFYLAGWSFIALCQHFKKPFLHSVAGSFVYIFCGYAACFAIRHPFYLNPMIQFPLLILGIDILLKSKKSKLFPLVICYSALCGFYFTYMMSLLMGIYFVVRFFDYYKEKRLVSFCSVAGSAILHYLYGIALSAVVFLPCVAGFLNSSERGGDALGSLTLFYSTKYYRGHLYHLFLPAGSESNLTICVLVLPALILMLVKHHKGKRTELLLTLSCILIFALPVFGSLFNGLSYPSNRWTYAFALLLAFIFVDYMDDIVAFIPWKLFPVCVIFFVILNTGYNTFYKFSPDKNGTINEFLPVGECTNGQTTNEYLNFFTAINDDSFYRVDGLARNMGCINNINPTNGYWSIENQTISELLDKVGSPEMRSAFNIIGMDDHRILQDLLSVKYLIHPQTVSPDTAPITSGIYENTSAVPFGFTYDKSSVVSYDDFEALNPLERETAMLSNIALEDSSSQSTSHFKNDSIVKEAAYEITEDTGDTMTLSFSLPANTGAYLYFDHLYVGKGTSSRKVSKLYVDCQGVQNSFPVLAAGHEHYTGKDQYVCNLGYSDAERSSLTITFDHRYLVSYDNIKILYYDYDNYLSNVSNLKKATLQNVSFTGNTLTGTIDLDEDKILCLSIPYANGWSAYVDGVKTDIKKGNYMFSCISLSSGSHEIEFRYRTPFFYAGLFISLFAVALGIMNFLNARSSRHAG